MRGRALLSALSLALAMQPVPALAGDEAIFGANGAQRVADSELEGLRGGFRWEGLDIQLGAELRSYISDSLVVQTNISWTTTHADVQRHIAEGLTPLSSSQLQGILGSSGLTGGLGMGSAFLTNNGQTAFIQRGDVALQNIILNTASNVAIRQELDAQLDITNFGPFQSGLISDRIGAALGAMIGLGGIGN